MQHIGIERDRTTFYLNAVRDFRFPADSGRYLISWKDTSMAFDWKPIDKWPVHEPKIWLIFSPHGFYAALHLDSMS